VISITYEYLSNHEGYHERENLWSEPIVYWEEEIPLRPQFSLLLADVGEAPTPEDQHGIPQNSCMFGDNWLSESLILLKG